MYFEIHKTNLEDNPYLVTFPEAIDGYVISRGGYFSTADEAKEYIKRHGVDTDQILITYGKRVGEVIDFNEI